MKKIGYFQPKMFLIYLGITVIGLIFNISGPGFLGMYALSIIIGSALEWVGDNIKPIYKYLGGGAFVAIFGSAFIRYLNIIPEDIAASVDDFVKNQDFIGLVVGALICGSILTMDRKLLIKAGSRYFVPIIGGIIVAFGLAGLVGAVAGYGVREAILFIALPIMGGGTSAGAVPTSMAYEAALLHDSGYYLALMMPAVCIGNALSVVAAGALDGMGKSHPKWTGNGKLIDDPNFIVKEDASSSTPDLLAMGRGFVATSCLYVVGRILAKFIPGGIHYYAWTIIVCAVLKIAGLVPEELEKDTKQWYNFCSKTMIPAVYFTVGFTYMNMQQVIESFTLTYFFIILATVVGAVIGTWFVGKLVKFYPIESAVTAGLCMANMGGSGDLAVLGAANRMELMPFAQISSRIGGALIIIIANVLAPIIGAGL